MACVITFYIYCVPFARGRLRCTFPHLATWMLQTKWVRVSKNRHEQRIQSQDGRTVACRQVLDLVFFAVQALIIAHLASFAGRVVSSLRGQAGMVGQALATHRSLCDKWLARRKGLVDGLERSPIQARQGRLAYLVGARPWHRASRSPFWGLGKTARRAFRRRLDRALLTCFTNMLY